MNFKFLTKNKIYIICIIAFLFIIIINVAFISSSPIPYYPQNVFTKQFPYNREGLTGKDENVEEDVENENVEEDVENENENESILNKKEGILSSSANKIDSSANKIVNKKKIETFQGLQGGDYLNEKYNGYLVNSKVDPTCGNISNGLSTSRGYVCLNKEEIRYLQSRGGNATNKGEF